MSLFLTSTHHSELRDLDCTFLLCGVMPAFRLRRDSGAERYLGIMHSFFCKTIDHSPASLSAASSSESMSTSNSSSLPDWPLVSLTSFAGDSFSLVLALSFALALSFGSAGWPVLLDSAMASGSTFRFQSMAPSLPYRCTSQVFAFVK